MRSIILTFANPEAAIRVKKVLIGAGLPVGQTCASGAALLQLAMSNQAGGVVILPSRLPDISVPELLSRLPDTFDLLVLQTPGMMADYDQLPGLTFLNTPIASALLTEMVISLLQTRRPSGYSSLGRILAVKERSSEEVPPPKRSAEDEALLRAAKDILMKTQGLTENQAHRRLQKRSMESGARLIDVARQTIEQGFV